MPPNKKKPALADDPILGKYLIPQSETSVDTLPGVAPDFSSLTNKEWKQPKAEPEGDFPTAVNQKREIIPTPALDAEVSRLTKRAKDSDTLRQMAEQRAAKNPLYSNPHFKDEIVRSEYDSLQREYDGTGQPQGHGIPVEYQEPNAQAKLMEWHGLKPDLQQRQRPQNTMGGTEFWTDGIVEPVVNRAFGMQSPMNTKGLIDDKGNPSAELFKQAWQLAQGQPSKVAEAARAIVNNKVAEYDAQGSDWHQFQQGKANLLHDNVVTDALGQVPLVGGALQDVARAPYYADQMAFGVPRGALQGANFLTTLANPTDSHGYAKRNEAISGSLGAVPAEKEGNNALDAALGMGARMIGEFSSSVLGRGGSVASAEQFFAGKAASRPLALEAGQVLRSGAKTPFATQAYHQLADMSTKLGDSFAGRYVDQLLANTTTALPVMYAGYFEEGLKKGYSEEQSATRALNHTLLSTAAMSLATSFVGQSGSKTLKDLFTAADKEAPTTFIGKLKDFSQRVAPLVAQSTAGGAAFGAGGVADKMLTAQEEGTQLKSSDLLGEDIRDSMTSGFLFDMVKGAIGGHGLISGTPQARAVHQILTNPERYNRLIQKMVTEGKVSPEQAMAAQGFMERIAPEVNAGIKNGLAPERAVQAGIEKARLQETADEITRLSGENGLPKGVTTDAESGKPIAIDPKTNLPSEEHAQTLINRLSDLKERASASAKALQQVTEGSNLRGRTVTGDEMATLSSRFTPSNALSVEQAKKIAEAGPYHVEQMPVSELAMDGLTHAYAIGQMGAKETAEMRDLLKERDTATDTRLGEINTRLTEISEQMSANAKEAKKEDIKASGLKAPEHQNPIVLDEKGDVIDGRKRLAHAIATGQKTIEVARPVTMQEAAKDISEEHDSILPNTPAAEAHYPQEAKQEPQGQEPQPSTAALSPEAAFAKTIFHQHLNDTREPTADEAARGLTDRSVRALAATVQSLHGDGLSKEEVIKTVHEITGNHYSDVQIEKLYNEQNKSAFEIEQPVAGTKTSKVDVVANIERKRQAELKGVQLPTTRDDVNNSALLKHHISGEVYWIPKEIQAKAYENDDSNNGKRHTAQPFQKILNRGGYDARELDTLYPNWRNDLPQVKAINEKYDNEQRALEESKPVANSTDVPTTVVDTSVENAPPVSLPDSPEVEAVKEELKTETDERTITAFEQRSANEVEKSEPIVAGIESEASNSGATEESDAAAEQAADTFISQPIGSESPDSAPQPNEQPAGQQRSAVIIPGKANILVDGQALKEAGWNRQSVQALQARFAKASGEDVTLAVINDATAPEGKSGSKGWYDRDSKTVYINIDKAGPTTAIHEFGHFWTSWVAEHAPEIHGKGLDLARKTDAYKYAVSVMEGKDMPVPKGVDGKMWKAYAAKYGNKPTALNDLAEEVLVQTIEQEAKNLSPAERNAFGTWLKSFFDKMKSAFGFGDITAQQFARLSLKEFSQHALVEFSSGKEWTKKVGEAIKAAKAKEKIVKNERVVDKDAEAIDPSLAITAQMSGKHKVVGETEDEGVQADDGRSQGGRYIPSPVSEAMSGSLMMDGLDRFHPELMGRLMDAVATTPSFATHETPGNDAQKAAHLLETFLDNPDSLTPADKKIMGGLVRNRGVQVTGLMGEAYKALTGLIHKATGEEIDPARFAEGKIRPVETKENTAESLSSPLDPLDDATKAYVEKKLKNTDRDLLAKFLTDKYGMSSEDAHAALKILAGEQEAPKIEVAPAPMPDKNYTSIKNEVVDEERAKRGLPPAIQAAAKEFGQSWDEAMVKLERNPNASIDLVKTLGKKAVAIGDVENALLLHRQIELQNEYGKTVIEINEGKDVQENNLRMARVLDDMQELYDVNKAVGTENARGLATRKMLGDEDYSLPSMLAQKRSMNGGKPLSKEAIAIIEKQHEKIAITQKAFDDYRAKTEAARKRAAGKTRKDSPLPEYKEAKRKSILDGIRKKLGLDNAMHSLSPDERVLPDELVKDVKALANLYTEGTEAEMIDKVHSDLVEMFPGLTKEEVQEAIFTRKTTTKSEEAKNQAALKAAEKSMKEYERRLLEKDLSPREKLMGYTPSPEVIDLRRQRDDLRKQYQQMVADANRKSPEEAALDAFKKRTEKSIQTYKDKVANEDFAPKPKKEPIRLDDEGLRLQAENERAKSEFRISKEQDRLKNRSGSERAQDAFVKWQRAFKLSGIKTLGKLTAAALWRVGFTPAEEIIGGGISKLIPKVAAKATREGGLNVHAESVAITKGFMRGVKDGWKNIALTKNDDPNKKWWEPFKYKYGGKSDLEAVYGKEGLPAEAAEYFGHLHSALKATPKRMEFERSYQKRDAFYQKQGIDTEDPLIQTKISAEAYKDANRAIFMNDNVVAEWWTNSAKNFEAIDKVTGKPKAKEIATLMRWLVPFVKVPLNILAETVTYSTGLGSGTWKLGKAIIKGLDTLEPHEAEIIMRHLKKGSLGAGLMLMGYFQPSWIQAGGYYTKDKDGEDNPVEFGGLRIGGVELPKWMIHNPLLETLQIGATIRKVQDHYLHKGESAGSALSSGVKASLIGIGEEIPFSRLMGDITKFKENNGTAKVLNEMAKSTVDPAMLQEIAKWTDAAKRRIPEPSLGKGTVQSIETGIPGLRQNVPDHK